MHFSYDLTHYIFLIQSPSYFITPIHPLSISQFGIHKALLKQRLETSNKNPELCLFCFVSWSRLGPLVIHQFQFVFGLWNVIHNRRFPVAWTLSEVLSVIDWWYHFVNWSRREFAEYLLVFDPVFLSPKEHQASPRDMIGGIEPLVVDILIFLD